jgi:hypothetical protein
MKSANAMEAKIPMWCKHWACPNERFPSWNQIPNAINQLLSGD